MNVDNKIQDVRSAPPVGPVHAIVGVASVDVLTVPDDSEMLIEYMEINNATGGQITVTLTDSFMTCAGATPNPVIGVYTVPANTNLPVRCKNKMVMGTLQAIATGASVDLFVHGRNLRGFYTN